MRAAEPVADAPAGWRVNTWVKRGILLGFRIGETIDVTVDHGRWPFFDKDTLPLKRLGVSAGVRIVPGGSSVRDGAYVGKRVICMPPMYINIGAYVDDESLVDSHALVGSCAQIGRRVHVSAAAQIGGVLEPAGALPVIVEDDVLIGGNCGVYEGAIVKSGPCLRPGRSDAFHTDLRHSERNHYRAASRRAAYRARRRSRRSRIARDRHRSRRE